MLPSPTPTPTPSIKNKDKDLPPSGGGEKPPKKTPKELTEGQERVGAVVDNLADAEITITPSRAAKWIQTFGWERVSMLLAKIRRGNYIGKSPNYLQTILESGDPITSPPTGARHESNPAPWR